MFPRQTTRPEWRTAAAATWLTVALAAPPGLTAQEPERPPGPAETEAQEADTLAAEDTLPPPRFPSFPHSAAGEPAVAASWDLPDLLATGALSLGDLLEFEPSLYPLRAGFLEGPQVAAFEGRGAAALRVDADGYELAPLAGGPLDLHLLSLVELGGARLIRDPGGYRLTTQTYRNDRREAHSRISAGTGDYDANLLRAFLSTRIGGAVLGFGFDRFDTNGIPDLEEADRAAVWLSLAHRMPWGLWGQLEYRGATAERDTFPPASRQDWILRLRRSFGEGWHADLVAGSSSVEQDTLAPSVELEAGTARAIDAKARQVALRAARTAERWRAQLTLRAWDGEHVPRFDPEATLEWHAGPASIYASGRVADWEDFQSAAGYAALRLRLPLGLSALAELEEGDRGLFGRRPRRRLGFTRWTAGAELSLLGWRAGARAGRSRADPSPGLTQPFDTLVALPGGTVDVLEAWLGGTLLKPFGGTLEAFGRYRSRGEGPLYLYWPVDDWRVEGRYHVEGLADQLQVWLRVVGGVRGSMIVQDQILGTADLLSSGNLNWLHGEAVVRIKDFHFFYNYQFFEGDPDPADIPGFVLPRARAHFGVNWTFWN